MMREKKISFPKSNNNDVLKLGTDIKSTITKLTDRIKNKYRIINEYAKIMHGAQKEYQKLFSENSRYKKLFQQQQQLQQK